MTHPDTPHSRAAEEKTERRRKRGSTTVSGLKLHVDPEKLDPAYKYRWVNDTPGRVQQLYEQDWDKVEDRANTDGGGTVPTKHVGVDSGKPINAVLMRKRREHFEEDFKEKQRPLDEIEQSIRRGVVHEQNEPELRGEVAYTPGSGNTISR